MFYVNSVIIGQFYIAMTSVLTKTKHFTILSSASCLALTAACGSATTDILSAGFQSSSRSPFSFYFIFI